MPQTAITTVRFSKEDREEIEALMDKHGFDQLSPFIRYAIKQLKTRKR